MIPQKSRSPCKIKEDFGSLLRVFGLTEGRVLRSHKHPAWDRATVTLTSASH